MALKRLYTEEMIQISGTWVDTKGKVHKAILASRDLAPAMDRLKAVHSALAALAQPAADNPRFAAISQEEARVDTRHDSIIRGGYALLTGTALLLGGDLGTELLKLRDTLIPDGLQSTQKTYRAEAGQAAQLAARLTPALREVLTSIVVGPKGNKKALESFVDEWITCGKKLGELEDEKGHLQPAPAETSMNGGAALLAARNKWIRVANAMVANGEAAELEEEADKLIFGPLRAAERNAERRVSANAASADGGQPGAPSTSGEGVAPTPDAQVKK